MAPTRHETLCVDAYVHGNQRLNVMPLIGLRITSNQKVNNLACNTPWWSLHYVVMLSHMKLMFILWEVAMMTICNLLGYGLRLMEMDGKLNLEVKYGIDNNRIFQSFCKTLKINCGLWLPTISFGRPQSLEHYTIKKSKHMGNHAL